MIIYLEPVKTSEKKTRSFPSKTRVIFEYMWRTPPQKMEFLCGPRYQNGPKIPTTNQKLDREGKTYAKILHPKPSTKWAQNHPKSRRWKNWPRAKNANLGRTWNRSSRRSVVENTMKWAFHSSVRSLEMEKLRLSHAGWWIGGIFFLDFPSWNEMGRKDTQTKRWHDWKRMEFSFPKQMHASLFLLPTFRSEPNNKKTQKHPQIPAPLGAGKNFPSLFFFVSLFWGSEQIEAWGLDSGWWFQVGCLWWDVFLLIFWWVILIIYGMYVYIHVCLWDFYGFFDVYGMFLFLFQEASSGFSADDGPAGTATNIARQP